MDAIGRQVDRYVIEAPLGIGGFGTVYRARHTVIDRAVALKLLNPDRASAPQTLERFLQEAKAAAAIGSPHIVQVLDAGISSAGEPFLAMELLDGEDLKSRLQSHGALPFDEAIEIALQILTGLGAAHAAGIVHRDLKPANVFLARNPGGEVAKLLDFGVSKFAPPGHESDLTRTGIVLGTPHYMAPECFSGSKSAAPRSDLYSVGVILYEMLSGRMPFEADSYQQLILRVTTEPPTPLAKVAPTVPPTVAMVVDRALARDADARWQNSADFKKALSTARAGNAPSMGAGGSTALLGNVASAAASFPATTPERRLAPTPSSHATPAARPSAPTPQPHRSPSGSGPYPAQDASGSHPRASHPRTRIAPSWIPSGAPPPTSQPSVAPIAQGGGGGRLALMILIAILGATVAATAVVILLTSLGGGNTTTPAVTPLESPSPEPTGPAPAPSPTVEPDKPLPTLQPQPMIPSTRQPAVIEPPPPEPVTRPAPAPQPAPVEDAPAPAGPGPGAPAQAGGPPIGLLITPLGARVPRAEAARALAPARRALNRCRQADGEHRVQIQILFAAGGSIMNAQPYPPSSGADAAARCAAEVFEGTAEPLGSGTSGIVRVRLTLPRR